MGDDDAGRATSSAAATSIPTSHRASIAGEDHPLALSSPGTGYSAGEELHHHSQLETNLPDTTQPIRRGGAVRPRDVEHDRRLVEIQAWLQSAREETAAAAAAQPPSESTTAEDARRVRRNMLAATWQGFALLTKGRRWILALRTLIGLAQLAVGIAILALPTSLGDSFSTPQTCDPEGMFVYLTLHITRVFLSIPIDFYLGLSPHRTSRARRIGAEGQMERERTRLIGSLALDRKLSRFSDLLGLCHVVLFIVGNYIVWTSVECSHYPADSRPLWITCVCMLSITYIIILEVAAMIFLLVFFLPLLIGLLHVFGLSNRIPQRALHPETGKISQDAIDEQSRLVYFTLAQDDDVEGDIVENKQTDMSGNNDGQAAASAAEQEEATLPSPLSRVSTSQSRHSTQRGVQSEGTARKKRFSLLFAFSRRSNTEEERERREEKKSASNGHNDTSATTDKLRPTYPLYPLPPHRASCPICLCDFEEIDTSSLTVSTAATPPDVRTGNERRNGQTTKDSRDNTDLVEDPGAGEQTDPVEPLRLLRCGHVMHMTCVDQWLTTVSGRCPVCQKPLLATSDGAVQQ